MSTIASHSHSPLNISETVGLIEASFQRTIEMVYGKSIGHVIDDVRWPRNVKSWPQYA